MDEEKSIEKAAINKKIEISSRRILNSLAEEIQSNRFPTTRYGIIADVREGSENQEAGDRIFVISYADGYVYMTEKEAPEWTHQSSREDLIGKEIQFKPLNVTDTAIFVSSRLCTEMYRKAMEDGSILKGIVTSVFYDRENRDNSYFLIASHGDLIRMPRNDFSVFGTPEYLPQLTGRKISFRVTGVDDDGTVHISSAVVEAEIRDEVIEELEKNSEGVAAEVVKVKPSCAYLEYKGVPLILRNKDFSKDYTPVHMVKHKGDTMLVKLLELSKTKRIFVEPVEKYKATASLSASKFEKGQISAGDVAGVSPWGIFVRVMPGVDVLCPVPLRGEPSRGERVQVIITRCGERTDKEGNIQPAIRGIILNTERSDYSRLRETAEKSAERETVKISAVSDQTVQEEVCI